MISTHTIADTIGITRRSKQSVHHEERDLHEADEILGNAALLDEILEQRAVGVRSLMSTTDIFRPISTRKIRGMGTVYDYRDFTRPNGGLIKPLVFVQHIPVIRQMDGRADLDVLWKVLVAQGLMVHNATDGEGNVALYAPMNRLCYHARGANGLSVGTEHMHLTTGESWGDRQINAAAYLVHRAKTHQDVPRRMGALTAGAGVVGVRRRGQTSHMEVSAKAGFNDRSDPGPNYPWREIEERSIHFSKHHRF